MKEAKDDIGGKEFSLLKNPTVELLDLPKLSGIYTALRGKAEKGR